MSSFGESELIEVLALGPNFEVRVRLMEVELKRLPDLACLCDEKCGKEVSCLMLNPIPRVEFVSKGNYPLLDNPLRWAEVLKGYAPRKLWVLALLKTVDGEAGAGSPESSAWQQTVSLVRFRDPVVSHLSGDDFVEEILTNPALEEALVRSIDPGAPPGRRLTVSEIIQIGGANMPREKRIHEIKRKCGRVKSMSPGGWWNRMAARCGAPKAGQVRELIMKCGDDAQEMLALFEERLREHAKPSDVWPRIKQFLKSRKVAVE